jgi:hypothetical protein
MMMKKLPLAIASLLLAVTGATFAQSSGNGVTVSRDPAKAAAVERHAADIKANANAATPAVPAKPAARHHARKHAKHHAAKHGKKHAKKTAEVKAVK